MTAKKKASVYKRVRRRRMMHRAELYRMVNQIKAERTCRYCQEDNPACLDFDHRDAGKKKHNVSDMVRDDYSAQKVLNEINKCDVVCSNCHRKKTRGESPKAVAPAVGAPEEENEVTTLRAGTLRITIESG